MKITKITLTDIEKEKLLACIGIVAKDFEIKRYEVEKELNKFLFVHNIILSGRICPMPQTNFNLADYEPKLLVILFAEVEIAHLTIFKIGVRRIIVNCSFGTKTTKPVITGCLAIFFTFADIILGKKISNNASDSVVIGDVDIRFLTIKIMVVVDKVEHFLCIVKGNKVFHNISFLPV